MQAFCAGFTEGTELAILGLCVLNIMTFRFYFQMWNLIWIVITFVRLHFTIC